MITYKDKFYSWPLNKNDLEYFYCKEKLSGEKISSLFGITSGTVSYFRKKYKIETIKSWERNGFPSELSNLEKEIILGYVLGDGYLGLSLSSTNAHLRVSQSAIQKPFVDQMYNYLIKWTKYSPALDSHYDKRYDKNYYVYRFDTISHPCFTELHKLCYKNKTKTITKEWLNYIGPLGLCLWYQGDGGLNTGKNSSYIHTCSFTAEEHELIIEWFLKKWNISTRICKKDKYLMLSIDDKFELKTIIEEHTIPYFHYKLPLER